MNELVKEMDKQKIDTCTMQETRRQERGTVMKKNYVISYSRYKSDKREFWIGFYIIRYYYGNLLDLEPVNERFCKIRVQLKL